jgi:HPt (histidine-containing phosphotransfer) domain-containing protein
MAELAELLKRMRSAYEIFVSELDNHLYFFWDICSSLERCSNAEEISRVFAEHAQKLEHRFHVIKGGAGFLKLERTAQLAAKAEGWFKHRDHQTPIDGTLKTDLTQLVAELEKEATELKNLLKTQPC